MIPPESARVKSFEPAIHSGPGPSREVHVICWARRGEMASQRGGRSHRVESARTRDPRLRCRARVGSPRVRGPGSQQLEKPGAKIGSRGIEAWWTGLGRVGCETEPDSRAPNPVRDGVLVTPRLPSRRVFLSGGWGSHGRFLFGPRSRYRSKHSFSDSCNHRAEPSWRRVRGRTRLPVSRWASLWPERADKADKTDKADRTRSLVDKTRPGKLGRCRCTITGGRPWLELDPPGDVPPRGPPLPLVSPTRLRASCWSASA